MASSSFPTTIGHCTLSWDQEEITGFSLPPASDAGDAPPPWIETIISRVQYHLAGDFQDFTDLPYSWSQVSPFQRSVYQTALHVQAGQTWTYGQLAKASGQPSASARAVGHALGQNPWPLLIPCHRFVGSDGRMTGFSAPGGIKTKLRLLVIEGAELFAE